MENRRGLLGKYESKDKFRATETLNWRNQNLMQGED